MKKKPVIITIVIVAVAAILIGGGIYLYPHLVERTISQVVDNDMTDIVKIEVQSGTTGKTKEVTNKEDIEEITNLFKNIKVKKSFDQSDKMGFSLGIKIYVANGEVISLSSGQSINGINYDYNVDLSVNMKNIVDYIEEKYELNN